MSERGVADEMAQALATVRETFRSSASERLTQLRRHADAWKAHTPGAGMLFLQTVHSLRGNAGTLGFSEVARIALELEKLAEGESPAFSSRIPGLMQSLAEAFAHPPSTVAVVPHRPRVVVRLSDSTLASELLRHLETFGLDAVHAPSDEDAVRLLTSERPVERVVMGPAVSPALRAALRATGSPPLLVQLVPAEARSAHREGADAVLSLGTPAPALAREIASLQRATVARFRVLAVDDDSAVLTTVRAVLEAAALEVVTLNDARNLFSSLQRHHPDLLLLDVAMPSIDGFDLLAQLRNEPAWRNLTVVFHTARETASDRVRAFQLGVDDYLIKPVEPAELRVRVLAHLQRRALLRAAAEKDSTGLATAHALQRTLSRLLEAAGSTTPVSVALLRFPKAEQLTEHASRLMPRARPSDVMARWDERTLALARSGEDARALLSFLQAPPGMAEALVGVADNRGHPGMGAQALITAAELNIGRGLESSAAKPGSGPRPETPTRLTTPPAPPGKPSSPPTLPPLPPRPPGVTPAPGPTAPRPTPGTRPADAAGQSRSQRILVADDEPALRRVLQRLLEQEGYVVETVEDGEEALARLLNPNLTPVDLLLLDVHMPRRSGIDVLRALREASSPVRALVLSARVRDADVLKLYGEGAADFVAKPFSIHTLLARVTRLLPPR